MPADKTQPNPAFAWFRAHRLAVGLILVWFLVMGWNSFKPLPPGVHVESADYLQSDEQLRFLYDLTYTDDYGELKHEQQIFDAMLDMIDVAQHFIILDFFLFNNHEGRQGVVYRRLSDELLQKLSDARRTKPGIQILLITDPINAVYGGDEYPIMHQLREVGAQVVITDLDRLRDSNPLYSSWWRMFVRWFDNTPKSGWIPNPLRPGVDRVSLRTWLAMTNFKANHRKTLITDDGNGGLRALITSANPHDISSAHSNVAMTLAGPIVHTIIENELSVARWSGWDGELSVPESDREYDPAAIYPTRYLSEKAIRDHLLEQFNNADQQTEIDMAMFYLSDRLVINALVGAAKRGAMVRIILDANKDAFGIKKSGIPNREVAEELVTRSGGKINIRWYATHGEQFHSKITRIANPHEIVVSLGSANLTKRNLGNFNLESNIVARMHHDSPLDQQISGYFDRIWLNTDGSNYTLDFAAFNDSSRIKYWRYRAMEGLGMSTF